MATLLDRFAATKPATNPEQKPQQPQTPKPATRQKKVNRDFFADMGNFAICEIRTRSDSMLIGDNFYFRITPEFLLWQSKRIERAFSRFDQQAEISPAMMEKLGASISFFHECLDVSNMDIRDASTQEWKLPEWPDVPDLKWSRHAFAVENYHDKSVKA